MHASSPTVSKSHMHATDGITGSQECILLVTLLRRVFTSLKHKAWAIAEDRTSDPIIRLSDLVQQILLSLYFIPFFQHHWLAFDMQGTRIIITTSVFSVTAACLAI